MSDKYLLLRNFRVYSSLGRHIGSPVSRDVIKCPLINFALQFYPVHDDTRDEGFFFSTSSFLFLFLFVQLQTTQLHTLNCSSFTTESKHKSIRILGEKKNNKQNK